MKLLALHPTAASSAGHRAAIVLIVVLVLVALVGFMAFMAWMDESGGWEAVGNVLMWIGVVGVIGAIVALIAGFIAGSAPIAWWSAGAGIAMGCLIGIGDKLTQ